MNEETDAFEMGLALNDAIGAALDAGSDLADLVSANTIVTPAVAQAAAAFQEKRAEVRSLRRALTAAVAG